MARRAVGDLLHRVGAADRFDDLLFLVAVAVLRAGLLEGRAMRGRGLVVAILMIIAVMIVVAVIVAVMLAAVMLVIARASMLVAEARLSGRAATSDSAV